MAIDTGNYLAMQALSNLQVTLDQAAIAHGESVRSMLIEHIQANGGIISFAEFMHLALYAPGLGYYTSGMRNFGTAGDFVTAPEISDLFGHVMARQVLEVHEQTSTIGILEIGAGSGALARAILSRFLSENRPVEYSILEVSPDHADRQREALAGFDDAAGVRVRWLHGLPEAAVDGVIIANEVLDALPVERFRIGDTGVEQFAVTVAGDSFEFVTRSAPPAVRNAVCALQESLDTTLPPGYVSEVSLALPQWVREVATVLGRGLLLFSDYGYARRDYYAPERHAGTLMCHLRHQAHSNPLLVPGLQDITAWVDFTAVAEAGTEAGLDLAGFTTQAHFLMGAGLADELAGAEQSEQVRRAAEIKTLTLPGEMGERFRFMGFTRGIIDPVAGFSLKDLRHTL